MSEEEFARAVETVNNFTSRPPDETLLHFYGLYKQATVGDVNTTKPSFWDPKGQAKWSAWESFRSLTPQQAREYYIKLVNQMVAKGW